MHRCAQRRTGGGGRAQQPGGRVSGADGVGIEPRVAVGGDAPQVAAPWVVRVSPHEIRRSHGLAHSHGRDAARRLGLDPRGARRALVAADGAGHVRACTRRRNTSGPRRCRRSQCIPVTRAVPGVRTVPTQYSKAAYRPPAPWSPREYALQRGSKPHASSAPDTAPPTCRSDAAVRAEVRPVGASAPERPAVHGGVPHSEGCTRYMRGTHEYGTCFGTLTCA